MSGSGKSILGYQVAVEGATQLGKRSLVVSLDEHPAQILRNAELLGLGLQAQVEAGLVHLFHASPSKWKSMCIMRSCAGPWRGAAD